MRNKKLIILFSVLLAVTLLVVFNSVLFSVQHVQAYCANRANPSYTQEVMDNHRIKKGSGIFFIDEKSVAKRIEENVPHVRVLNIERKFPNRVYINYIEIVEYIKIYHNEDGNVRTYYLSNDMRVMGVEEGYDTSVSAIHLKVKGDVSGLAVGAKPTFASSSVQAVVAEIFSALERMGYYEEVIDLFSEIDLTGNFLDMTTKNGLKWRILSADDLAEKLRFALSVYYSDKLDEKQTGMLIVSGTRSATYDKDA